jgi:hypothetical protein
MFHYHNRSVLNHMLLFDHVAGASYSVKSTLCNDRRFLIYTVTLSVSALRLKNLFRHSMPAAILPKKGATMNDIIQDRKSVRPERQRQTVTLLSIQCVWWRTLWN